MGLLFTWQRVPEGNFPELNKYEGKKNINHNYVLTPTYDQITLFFQVNTVFDYQRFIMYSRIIKTGNPPRLKICIRDKEAENLLDMFQVRKF